MSNMLEAEIHGRRSATPEYIVTVDGFSIIVRKAMLDKMGGFDSDYKFHHLYDKNIGMDALNAGYKCLYVPVPVHHWSGKSANGPEYQNWINEKMGSETGDMDTMRHNMKIFNQKWLNCLPLEVDSAGNSTRPVIKNPV